MLLKKRLWWRIITSACKEKDCNTNWKLRPVYLIPGVLFQVLLELTISKVNSGPSGTLPSISTTFNGDYGIMPICYEQVSYLPMSVIITTFKRENVKWPLEGFGVLVPSKEQGLRTLGNFWTFLVSHFMMLLSIYICYKSFCSQVPSFRQWCSLIELPLMFISTLHS